MKEKHKILYTINKYLLGGFFLAYYRPKFENKHLVPKDGPIILCGNHVHLFDQCLPILSTGICVVFDVCGCTQIFWDSVRRC